MRGLQLDGAPEFHRREWQVEQASWVLIGLVIVAGLLGLFGNQGPLNRATAEAGDGSVRLDYDRFGHRQASMTLRVHLNPAEAETTAAVWLSRSFADSIQITGFQPEPQNTIAEADRLIYVFEVTGPAPVTIFYQPQGAGRLEGRLGLGREPGRPEVRFSQFIYP